MIDLAPATRRTAELIVAISEEHFKLPTPCPQYTVGDLVHHMDGLALAFTEAAAKHVPEGGTSGPVVDASLLEDGWRDRVPRRLAALAEAWLTPVAWEGMTEVGGVELPGDIAGLVALDEVVVHGWDLARALDLPYSVDPGLIEACMTILTPQPDEPERPVGDDVMFGRPVEISPEAPPLDRLVAMAGRNPLWTPPEH
ncbi:TIGR03086 family metal-binding protein [Spirillospora sp. CA-294931]|uniref:TIGR03086 family metal-binding protein n=1 Tax=Spirillospora sp. CA-294931 TaxID=3240042 RepID=UPI003D8FEEEA